MLVNYNFNLFYCMNMPIIRQIRLNTGVFAIVVIFFYTTISLLYPIIYFILKIGVLQRIIGYSYIIGKKLTLIAY